jgi:hypothetical protein
MATRGALSAQAEDFRPGATSRSVEGLDASVQRWQQEHVGRANIRHQAS